MRNVLNKLNTITNILFVGAVIYSIILLHTLPDELFEKMNSIYLVNTLYLTFCIGFIGVFVHYLILNSTYSKDIIYVDRIAKEFLNDSDDNKGDSESDRVLGDSRKEFDRIIHSEEDMKIKFEKILSILCNRMDAGQGIVFKTHSKGDKEVLKQFATYAFVSDEEQEFEIGEGLVGLVAKEDKLMSVDDLNESYLSLYSGLGKSSPVNVLILPLKAGEKVSGVLELALFHKPSEEQRQFFSNLSLSLGELLAK